MLGPVTEPAPTLLTLHALRLRGAGDAGRVAGRFGLDRDVVDELLLDFEAYGWVRRADLAGPRTWTLTDAGRAEGERRLAAELDAAGDEARATVTEVHAAFLPLNARFQQACTDWQLRPAPGDSMAANDHTDHRWDDRVIAELGSLGRRLRPLADRLAAALPRFAGYADRYAAAVARVDAGERSWVDGLGRDSCHTVWFELHEDLLATLGIDRGAEVDPSDGGNAADPTSSDGG